MSSGHNQFTARSAWAKALVGGLLTLGSVTSASAQAPPPYLAPQPQAQMLLSPIPPAPNDWTAPGWVAPTDASGSFSFWDTVKQSVCGHNCGNEWTPLCCGTDGLCQPWVNPGPGCSGAPRQSWINTFDAFFTRQAVVTYNITNRLPGGQDLHEGQLSIQTPLSRRLWLGIDVPFVESLQGGRGPSTSHFGDVSITPKFMLYESKDFSLSTGLTVRTPTGTEITGGDRTTLLPFVAFWTDLGRGVSLRGGTGVDIAVDHKRAADGDYVANLSVGQTIVRQEGAPLGDFTYFLATNWRQEFGERSSDHTFFSLTPGFRTSLGRDWAFRAGYEVPVVGPKLYEERLTFVLEKGW